MRIKYFALIGLLILSACDTDSEDPPIPVPLPQDLLDNRDLWQTSMISNYTLNYFAICNCPTQLVSVSVVNQQIVAVQIRDSNDEVIQDVEAIDFSRYNDVDGFFDLIERAYGTAGEVRPTYHAEFGYPSGLFIDYFVPDPNNNVQATDTTVRYRIEFQRM